MKNIMLNTIRKTLFFIQVTTPTRSNFCMMKDELIPFNYVLFMFWKCSKKESFIRTNFSDTSMKRLISF